MQMCEVVSNGEVVYAIFSCCIAFIDMYLGFPVFKESVLSLQQEEVANESKDFADVGAAPQNEEELGKYGNVNADSSRDTKDEIQIDTDGSTEFSASKGPKSTDMESKWKKQEEDIVKLDGEGDDMGHDPNKA